MIERLLLPNRATPSQFLVDRSGRSAFDRLKNPNQGKDLPPVLIGHWRENQMRMIGHDHSNVQFVSLAMIVATSGEHNIPSGRRQYPPEFRHKGDEVRREVFLQMRKIAAIELHPQNTVTLDGLSTKSYGKMSDNFLFWVSIKIV